MYLLISGAEACMVKRWHHMMQVPQTNGKTPTPAAKEPAVAKKLHKKPSENGAMPAPKKVKAEKVGTFLYANLA